MGFYMSNIISMQEILIKRDIKYLTEDLVMARGIVAEGKMIPPDLIPRLENLIYELEQRLIEIIENEE
jgi:hypothetical protein